MLIQVVDNAVVEVKDIYTVEFFLQEVYPDAILVLVAVLHLEGIDHPCPVRVYGTIGPKDHHSSQGEQEDLGAVHHNICRGQHLTGITPVDTVIILHSIGMINYRLVGWPVLLSVHYMAH